MFVQNNKNICTQKNKYEKYVYTLYIGSSFREFEVREIGIPLGWVGVEFWQSISFPALINPKGDLELLARKSDITTSAVIY